MRRIGRNRLATGNDNLYVLWHGKDRSPEVSATRSRFSGITLAHNARSWNDDSAGSMKQ